MSDDGDSAGRSAIKTGIVAVAVFLFVVLVAAPALSALFTNSVPVTDVTLGANNGPNATFIGSGDANLTQPFPDDNTIVFNSTFANLTVRSPKPTDITFRTLDANWINASDIDTTNANISIYRSGFEYAEVGGSIDTFNLTTTIKLDDGNTDFRYGGSSGKSTVVISGLPANDKIYAVETAGFPTLDVTTTNSSGFAHFTNLDNSQHSVTLQTTVVNSPPVIDDDSATPKGAQNTYPTQLSAQVNDSDFPSGESVDLTWELDGVQQGTATINSNGTYTQAVTITTGGSHTWTLNATDSSGASDESTFSFTTPATGSVFNETKPETKITDPVDLKFYPQGSNDTIKEVTTTNGDFDLAGLPLNQDIVITASAADYHDRHIVIESLAEQPRIYMLNSTAAVTFTTIDTTFTLTDRSGIYPPSSTQLFVEREINRTRNSIKRNEWETMAADVFGQDGWTTTLQGDQRYRLRIKNEDGDVAVLGEYTSGLSDETVALSVGQLNGTLEEQDGYFHNGTYVEDPGGDFIRFRFRDDTDSTTNMDITIHEYQNESNVIFTGSFAGPHGNLTVTEPLTAPQQNKSWVINYTADRNGEQITADLIVSKGQRPKLGDIPWWLQQFIAIFSIFLVIGLASQANAQIGAFTGALVGAMFYWIGFLPAEVGGGVAIIGLLTAGAFYFRTRARPT